MSNWKKTILVLLLLIFLMIFPPTRQFVVFLLPLGRGIDDLIFIILLFAFIVVAMIKLGNIDEVIARLRKWFSE